jgi:hypothetical protein
MRPLQKNQSSSEKRFHRFANALWLKGKKKGRFVVKYKREV